MSFASDAFSGTDLQELSLYSANWSKQSGYSDVFEIGHVSPTFAYARNAETVYQNSGGPASADYTVSADVTWLSGGSGAENPVMGVTGRNAAASANFYFVQARPNSTLLTLFKSISGSFTSLGAISNSMTKDVAQNHALVMAGTSISVSINGGAAAITATDSAISTAGKSGIYGGGMRETGVADVGSLDNFLAVDAGGGVDGSLMGQSRQMFVMGLGC